MAGNATEAHIIMPTSNLTVFPCVVKVIRDGTSPAHWHNFPQIWYVSKGEVMLTVADETVKARSGSCVFVPAYITHSISENRVGFEVYVISFTEAMFGGFDDEYFLAGKHPHINHRLINTMTDLTPTEKVEVTQLVGEMKTELLKGRGRNPAKISLAIITLLGEWQERERTEARMWLNTTESPKYQRLSAM